MMICVFVHGVHSATGDSLRVIILYRCPDLQSSEKLKTCCTYLQCCIYDQSPVNAEWLWWKGPIPNETLGLFLQFLSSVYQTYIDSNASQMLTIHSKQQNANNTVLTYIIQYLWYSIGQGCWECVYFLKYTKNLTFINS